jgi:hypothetical protein
MRVLGFYCKKVARKRDIEKKKKKKTTKTQNLNREMSQTPNAKSPSLAILNLSRACL